VRVQIHFQELLEAGHKIYFPYEYKMYVEGMFLQSISEAKIILGKELLANEAEQLFKADELGRQPLCILEKIVQNGMSFLTCRLIWSTYDSRVVVH
jgi:hypothetical protein